MNLIRCNDICRKSSFNKKNFEESNLRINLFGLEKFDSYVHTKGGGVKSIYHIKSATFPLQCVQGEEGGGGVVKTYSAAVRTKQMTPLQEC